MIPGENHREFVLSPEEEAKYLAAAREPLASVAVVLADSGMRPEECYRLSCENVTWVNGRFGMLLVTHGEDLCCASDVTDDFSGPTSSGRTLEGGGTAHRRMGLVRSHEERTS
jgi:hypothetical protein